MGDELLVTNSPAGNGGAVSFCSKCGLNQRKNNSSWCKPCLNEHAAAYRARKRKIITTEERECAFSDCANLFIWSSARPRHICCSKSCYYKYKWRKNNPEKIIEVLEEGLKRCTKCDEIKSSTEFSYSQLIKKSGQCRSCWNLYAKKWSSENVDRRSAASRRSKRRRLLKSYGAPSDDYHELLESQGGGCAICGAIPTSDLNIDHDHNKLEHVSYRGLLCTGCNIGLGGFKDDPEILMKAISYLQNAP